MNVEMHGKAIADIHFIEEYSGNPGMWFTGRDHAGVEHTVSLSATFHGDRDEFWVVLCKEGVEIARRNCKSIAQINWAVQS